MTASGIPNRWGWRTLVSCSLLLMASTAIAGGDVAVSSGYGPDRYRTFSIEGSVDLFRLPLQLDIQHFIARIDGKEELNQTSAGLSWYPLPAFSADVLRTHIKEELFDLDGNEYGLHFHIEQLWGGKLGTRLDLGYGDYQYAPNARPAVRAAIAPFVPDQKRYSAGFEQDLGDQFSVYGKFDEYAYTEDPLVLARLLLRRARNPSAPVFILIGFPERTGMLGLSWSATDTLTWDVSHSKTATVFDQVLESTQLGMAYQINDALLLLANIARTRSGAINTVRRGTIMEAEKGTYLELSVSYGF